MINLREVWLEVERLLDLGISLIPVRDKPEGRFTAKTPYRSWVEWQSAIISKEELWHQMEEVHRTTAVACICGRISGNLECIDIDVKYKPGVDALIFDHIKTFYPDLVRRLRIHRTPSGGWHIIYRVVLPDGVQMPGNKKLASRLPTDEEVAAAEAKGERAKPLCFVETRGEGGYFVAPPSLGYRVSKFCEQEPIPVLTWEERCSLINICISFTEIVKAEPKLSRPLPRLDTSYDESPFEHFNRTCDPVGLLTESGWQLCPREGARFLWFTRPGKDAGISASFNKERRIFWVFTSSTELDPDRGYNPATLVAILRFGGDGRAAYRWLVEQGYGRLKPKVEAQIVESEALKRTIGAGPANLSDEARAKIEAIKKEKEERYPFGVFWDTDEEGELFVDREGLYAVANGLGFGLIRGALHRIEGYIVRPVTDREFYDTVKAYVREPDGDTQTNIYNLYESFIQRNGAFTITRLQLIAEERFLRDTREASYKFYLNCYLKISRSGREVCSYEGFSHLVYHKQIQPRNYEHGEGGAYVDFLRLAFGLEGRPEAETYLQRVLGYLAHEYKDEATGYIIVLTEQCPTPEEGGGSGKNMFCSLLNHTTTYQSKPGSQTKLDEKFLQTWDGSRVFGINDVDKGFDFGFLKDPATGPVVVKKLYKDEVTVPNSEAPKFIVQTNYSYEIKDGGLRRRIIPLELTPFFTEAGGVDVYFGKFFTADWSPEDWAGYDNYIAASIEAWFNGGRKLKATNLSNTGWEKQFVQAYSQNMYALMGELWVRQELNSAGYPGPLTWLGRTARACSEGRGAYFFASNEEFDRHVDEVYIRLKVPQKYHFTAQRINRAFDEFAKRHGYKYTTGYVIKVDGRPVKGRRLELDVAEPPDEPGSDGDVIDIDEPPF